MSSCSYHEVGPPLNDGEREVLRTLRDGLPEGWFVVGNFEFPAPAGSRWYECDAFAISANGWGYLIETKQWDVLRGNDKDWLLQPRLGSNPERRDSPIYSVGPKAKKLASFFKSRVPGAGPIPIESVVVLVSDYEPELGGKSAAKTVMLARLLERLDTDPRPEQARRVPESGVVESMVEALIESARPLQPPEYLDKYHLQSPIEITDSSETWEATLAGVTSGVKYRVKRYFIDDLLTGAEREKQSELAMRDLQALALLEQEDGVVPFVSNAFPLDGSFVVATTWPHGQNLASRLLDHQIEGEEVKLLIVELFRSLAAVHNRGITHRNLRPSCLYVGRDRIFITDFDYSRLPGKNTIVSAMQPDVLDSDCAAPEVQQNPSAASQKSDVYSAALIARKIQQAVVGEDTNALIPESWEPLLTRCLSPNPDLRPANAIEVFEELVRGKVRTVDVSDLRINDVIDGRFVVRQNAVTTGGTSIVYQVFDKDHLLDYAAKFILPAVADRVDIVAEYHRLRKIPEHPGIVRPAFTERCQTVIRNGTEYKLETAFLLTDWVSGDSLADLISEALPIVRVMGIGADVARSLAHVREANVVHRDVKPENIILGDRGKPVLIDFNISESADRTLKTHAGTPPYMPPEITSHTGKWTFASDIYSLGICLSELISRDRLGNEKALTWVEDWEPGHSLEKLRSALLAALSSDPAARPDATAFAKLLEEARADFVSSLGFSRAESPPTYEKLTPNHNPYVDKLIGLFSQSSLSNSGTRGLDEFRKWLYVETQIDTKLGPAVLSGEIQLLLISGNAGDGKTAFIKMLEEHLRALGAESAAGTNGNGSDLRYGGLRFITNWDGSQDEGDTSNDDVLAEFFAPFSGALEPAPPKDLVAVIAINEGRLLDFLSDNRNDFPWLERELSNLLGGGEGGADWISVVNLNLRSLTADDRNEAIVEKLLARLADERLWEPCSTCAIADRCYAPANAAALRDPVRGPRMSERVRQVLDIVRLRRRMHITMRDLVSALAYSVAGNRQCQEIVELYENTAFNEIMGGFLYNALFAAADAAFIDTKGAGRDRLLAQLSPLDVAIRPIPEEDGKLWLSGPQAIPEVSEGPAGPDRLFLEQQWRTARESSRESGDWAGLRLAHASLRRKYYMEREDTAYLQMFPYEHLEGFIAALDKPPLNGAQLISEAISHSEGLRKAVGKEVLAVRIAQDLDAEDRSFIIHKSKLFQLEVVAGGMATRYIEHEPDLLRFRHQHIAALELEIDIDLWEALMRMGAGFTPSREDLRGSWLSLQMFKEKVASTPSSELLIQPRAELLTRVHVDSEGCIVAEAVR